MHIITVPKITKKWTKEPPANLYKLTCIKMPVELPVEGLDEIIIILLFFSNIG